MQVVNVFLCRDARKSSLCFGLLSNPLILVGIAAELALILAIEGVDFPEVRQVFQGLKERHPTKPLYLVIYGSGVKTRWLHDLEGLDIPVFFNSRLAVSALAAATRYAQARGAR